VLVDVLLVHSQFTTICPSGHAVQSSTEIDQILDVVQLGHILHDDDACHAYVPAQQALQLTQ